MSNADVQTELPKRKTLPTRTFQHTIIPQLPPLGWLFRFDLDGAHLICGSSVQVNDNGFREGCWAKLANESADSVVALFGSGMQTRNGKWLFLTPSHSLEALFFYRHRQGWSVSNSLSFLAAYHELKLPWNAGYGAKFTSISHGIDAYEKRLFDTGSGEVFRIICDNFELNSHGNFHLVGKMVPPPFPTFEAYTNYLRQSLKLAFNDGARNGYRPLATCSTGYDSACVAVLAAGLGCREAVTLKNSRGGDNDSGKAIAERLGFQVHEFERQQSAEQNFDEVAEFLATGAGGEDFCYRNFAPALKRRILLTGFRGGICWDLKYSPTATLAGAGLDGCSLQEFRLWNDFIHLPVPTIGSGRQPELLAISNSAEMAAWRLNNDYDRPIPRRILEESGVPRLWFGQKKKAASVLLFFDPRFLTPSVRGECEAAVPASSRLASKFGLARIFWELRYLACRLLCFVEKKVLKAIHWLKERFVQPWRVFEHSHPRAALEFLAAVSVLGRRYRRAVERKLTSE